MTSVKKATSPMKPIPGKQLELRRACQTGDIKKVRAIYTLVLSLRGSHLAAADSITDTVMATYHTCLRSRSA